MSTPDSSTIQTYFDLIANEYDQYAILQQQVATELLNRLDLISIEVKKLLDLGCGTGKSIKPLGKIFPKAKLHALDFSSAMLDFAHKNKPWLRKVFYQQNNANQIEAIDNAFDLVYSNMLLPSCSDPDTVFSQVQRVTRENGLFSFTSLGPDSFKELRNALTAAEIPMPTLAFGHLTDMHDLGDALIRAGLREPVMDVDYYHLSFKSFADLWQELRSSGCVFMSLEPEQLATVSEYYARENSQAFVITYEVVYGQAWAGDGISRARDPSEVQIPISEIKRRN